MILALALLFVGGTASASEYCEKLGEKLSNEASQIEEAMEGVFARLPTLEVGDDVENYDQIERSAKNCALAPETLKVGREAKAYIDRLVAMTSVYKFSGCPVGSTEEFDAFAYGMSAMFVGIERFAFDCSKLK